MRILQGDGMLIIGALLLSLVWCHYEHRKLDTCQETLELYAGGRPNFMSFEDFQEWLYEDSGDRAREALGWDLWDHRSWSSEVPEKPNH